MIKSKFEDIDFEESDIIEFHGDNFKIVYDEKCIYAELLDPEIDENLIILEGLYEGNEYKFDKDSIKIFSYVLTKEKFNQIKEFIKKEKANL